MNRFIAAFAVLNLAAASAAAPAFASDVNVPAGAGALADRGSDAYPLPPAFPAPLSPFRPGNLVPGGGSEGEIQTVGSLPHSYGRGFGEAPAAIAAAPSRPAAFPMPALAAMPAKLRAG